MTSCRCSALASSASRPRMRSSSELDGSVLALSLILSSLVISRARGRVKEASLRHLFHPLAPILPPARGRYSAGLRAPAQRCSRRGGPLSMPVVLVRAPAAEPQLLAEAVTAIALDTDDPRRRKSCVLPEVCTAQVRSIPIQYVLPWAQRAAGDRGPL